MVSQLSDYAIVSHFCLNNFQLSLTCTPLKIGGEGGFIPGTGFGGMIKSITYSLQKTESTHQYVRTQSNYPHWIIRVHRVRVSIENMMPLQKIIPDLLVSITTATMLITGQCSTDYIR